MHQVSEEVLNLAVVIAGGGRRGADRVIQFITNLFPNRKPVMRFPFEWLIELKSIFEIEVWERAGLKPLLPASLPSSDLAFDNMEQRIKHNPYAYVREKPGTELEAQVFETRIMLYQKHRLVEHTWSSMADTKIEDEEIYEVIADFLMNFRHLARRNGDHHERA